MHPHPHQADALAAPWNTAEAFRTASSTLQCDALAQTLAARWQGQRPVSDPRLELVAQWGAPDVPLVEGLTRAARRLLRFEGEVPTLVVDAEDPGREILRWRCISLRFPVGVLVTAAAPQGLRPEPRVRVLPLGLAPRGPIALQHVHVMAALPFEALWAHVMGRHERLRLKPEHCPPGFTVIEWRAVITRARLARHTLAEVMRTGARLLPEDHATGLSRRVWDALGELATGRVSGEEPMREIELWRLGARRPGPRPRPESFWACDPLWDQADWPEGALLARAFDHLAEGDPAFAHLLVQYLRVKCLLHTTLVSDPLRGGLDAFQRTYDCLSPYRQGVDESHLADFARNEPQLDLRAVELRTSPASAGRSRTLAAVAREAQNEFYPRGEIGWLFHLIRDMGAESKHSTCAHRARAASASMVGLAVALARDPSLLDVIRGVDVASREQRGELWLMLDALRRVREVSQRAAARTGLPPLRLTVHVGEDFPHLLSGLRAVHEPFLWGLIERGDRLGHALALGTDPAAWSARRGRLRVERWVRLLDLSWALDRVADGAFDVNGSILMRMQRELAELTAAGPGGVACTDIHRRLGDPGIVARLSLLDDQGHGPAERLIARRLRARASVPREVRWFVEPVEVDVQAELEVMRAAQDWLTRLVSRWQTVIEVNPSSNLLVAQFDHPLAQPVFRLRPVEPGAQQVVQVTINTDDPLTFATGLADEYAYAWAGMVLGAGVAPNYARAWLDDAAAAAWASRFTVPRNARSHDGHANTRSKNA
jgi:hypothetical protein